MDACGFLSRCARIVMGKITSKASSLFGRLVKIIVVAALIPLVIGLLLGMLLQLEGIGISGVNVRTLVSWGFLTYVGIHELLYRPVSLFRASHRLFSALAVWLFGGQVASVEGQGQGSGKGKTKGAKAADPASQGSTLVAFSPYVIPSYMVLLCVLSWALTHWVERAVIEGPVVVLIGMAMAFHWLMTANDLQQQRERWHVETYLLAIGLVFILTLLVGGACLPLAVPEFSFVQALGDGVSRAQLMYSTLIQRLFF